MITLRRFFLSITIALLLSGFFPTNSSSPIGLQTAQAANTCNNIDLLWIVDLGNTMSQPLGGEGRAKKYSITKTVMGSIGQTNFLGVQSRMAAVTFKTTTTDVIRNVPVNNQFYTSGNVAPLQAAIPNNDAGLGGDRRPIGKALGSPSSGVFQKVMGQTGSNKLYTILVTDSLPNIDANRYSYNDNDVAAVGLTNTDGSYKSVAEVQNSGTVQPGANGRKAGYVLAEAMQKTLDLRPYIAASDQFNAVYLDSNNSSPTHTGFLNYFASLGGSSTGNGRFARVTDSADLRPAIGQLFPCSGEQAESIACKTSNGTSSIGLPVGTPGQFTVEGGSGSVQWSSPDGTPSSGSNVTAFTTQYNASAQNTPGVTKTITVSRGGQNANCSVRLTFPPPSCSVSPNQTVSAPATVQVSATGGNPADYAWSNQLGTNSNPGNVSSFTTTYNTTGTYNITVTSDGQSRDCAAQIGIAAVTGLIIDLPPAWRETTNTPIADRLFTPKSIHLSAAQDTNPTLVCYYNGNFNLSSEQFTATTTDCPGSSYDVSTELITADSSGALLPQEQYYRIIVTGADIFNIDPNFQVSRSWRDKLLAALGINNPELAKAYAPPPAGGLFGILPQSVSCAPASQTTTVNQQINFTAAGGNGIFTWNAAGGNPDQGFGSSFVTRYGSAGSKTVTVSSAGQSANCDVTVNSGNGGALTCSPSTQNATPGQTVLLTASGGSGTYSWVAPTGSPNSGTGSSFNSSFPSTGSPHTVRLTDSTLGVVTCQVVVTAQLSCAPATQTVEVNTPATLTGSNAGASGYSWSTNASATPNSGTGASFRPAYPNPGTYLVTLSSGSLSPVTCQVVVTPSTEVFCSPASQSAYIGALVTVSASGGNSTYQWSAANGDPNTGSGTAFSTRYHVAGTHVIVVTSGPRTAQCSVTIVTPPPLSCSVAPAIQMRNQPVVATAVGGLDGRFGAKEYEWSAPGGNPSQQGPSTSEAFQTQYASAGTKTITVISGDQTETCDVEIKLYATKSINYRLSFLSGNNTADFKASTLLAAKAHLLVNGALDNMYLSDENCSLSNTGSEVNICFKTKVYYAIAGRAMPQPLVINELVPLTGSGGNTGGRIIIEGSVAGASNVGGFDSGQPQSALILGGTITNVVGGQQVSGYIDTSGLASDAVRGAIATEFSKRSTGQTVSITNYTSGQWRLNAAGDSPSDSTSSTASTPPEGKLWNVDGSGTLTFDGDVEFSGTGTIAFGGNIVFNGAVSCVAGTRLGVIAKGRIQFDNPAVGCGAFMAFNDTSAGEQMIGFPDQITGTQEAKGLFMTTGDIDLPNNVDAGNNYNIKYDKVFAANPTILFKEILKVIVENSS